MRGELLKQMVGETPLLFMVTALPEEREEMIDNLTLRYKQQNQLLHIIRGTKEEVKRLSDLLDR
jgi:hypothetical protein